MADWYCPVCGGRLSYGIYCKRCKAEMMFAARRATAEELAARASSRVVLAALEATNGDE